MILSKRTIPNLRQQILFKNNLIRANDFFKTTVQKLLNSKNKFDFYRQIEGDLVSEYRENYINYVILFVNKATKSYVEQINTNNNISYDINEDQKEEIITLFDMFIMNFAVMFLDKVKKALNKYVVLNEDNASLLGIDPSWNEEKLEKRLIEITEILDNHAIFVAEDLNYKLISKIEKIIYTNLGYYNYVWFTRNDLRVVGNPFGFYPTPTPAHGDHYVRNKKVFGWDMPPQDGHPGEAVGCRCYALTILEE